ncbi:MAG TPA: hypothetical protein VFK34_08460 [Marmoricola sp.]|jgi:hypothetical protein|nr:hypothetical protein [Marmoricola sp.]
MNTTTRHLTRYAGAALVAGAAACTFSTPAFAMPEPGVPPLPVHGNSFPATAIHPGDLTPGTPARTRPAEPGIDWSTLATGLAGGAALTGIVVVAGAEARRRTRQPHPA